MARRDHSLSRGRWERLLLTDFCPRANTYAYLLRKPLTLLVLAALASLACGLCVSPQGYVVLAILLGVIVAGVCWPWLGMKAISAEIGFSVREVDEGRPVTLQLDVKNRWPWPVWGLVLQGGLVKDSPEEISCALAQVPGWTQARFCFPFVPQCRGVYPEQIPEISTSFPFGVWTSRRPTRVSSSLTVWPRRISLTSRSLAKGRQMSLVTASNSLAGELEDCTGLRPHRRGDLLRNVHWAQSARLGRFVVKERQAAARGTVCVHLVLDEPLLRDRRAQGPFEWAMRIACSITAVLLHHQTSVEFRVGNRTWQLSTAAFGFRRFLDDIAAFQPGAMESHPSIPERSSLPRILVGSLAMSDRFQKHQSVLRVAFDSERFSLPAHGSDRESTSRLLATTACPTIRVEPGQDLAANFVRDWQIVGELSWRGTEITA